MTELEWYCLRTKPRSERLASQRLRVDAGVEVFCPLIRFERARRTGKLWVTEAMFPGYIFARFAYGAKHRQIRAIKGVVTVVTFGDEPAKVPAASLTEMRSALDDQETIIVKPEIQAGHMVNVIGGPFQGIRAVVSRLMPARERVAVLMEVLGMEREVEIGLGCIIPDASHPLSRSSA